MRTIFWAVVAAWVVLGRVFAQTPDNSDTMLRSAYCVGVLNESIDAMQRVLDEAKEAAQYFIDDYDRRRARYQQYLRVRILEASQVQRHALTVVMAKGRQDSARHGQDTEGGLRVLGLCTNSHDLAECVAKHDQVLANIIRCQQYPDRLPF